MPRRLRIVPMLDRGGATVLWCGVRSNTPPPVTPFTLRRNGQDTQGQWAFEGWSRVHPSVDYWVARQTLSGLASGGEYAVRIVGEDDDAARLRAWPAALPRHGDGAPPFTLHLGSCFDARTARRQRLPLLGSDERLPHLKLLAGDQVYLDLPFREDLPQDEDDLARKLSSKYECNWNGAAGCRANGAEFGGYLAQGHCAFVTDDHEYWNNYPYRQVQLPITWPWLGARDVYEAVSRQLVKAFQTPDGQDPDFSSWRIGDTGAPGSFSIAALEGRFHREGGAGAHSRASLNRAIAWLESLQGPAALAFSQPPTLPATRWGQRQTFDATLADFDDYGRLAAAVASCPHDLLLLSGDIHRARLLDFERIPHLGPLRPRRGALHEITASPMSLIYEQRKHKKGSGTVRFPAINVKGVPHRVARRRVDGLRQNQIAVLKLWAAHGGVRVELEFQAIPLTGERAPRRVWPPDHLHPHVMTLQPAP